MNAHRIFALAATGLIALSVASYGTTVGITPENQFKGYALWDMIGAASGTGIFNDYGAEVSNAGLVNAKLSQTRALTGGGGGGPYGAGDAIYTGSVGSTWVIEATTGFAATSLTLQVKFSKPYQQPIEPYFDPVLTFGGNSYSATSELVVLPTGEKQQGQDMYVLTWVFEDLNLSAGTEFRFDFAGAPAHVVVDGMAVGLDAIPEPSTWAAIASGASLLIGSQVLRRRRA